MTENLVLVVTVTALCMVSPGPDMLLVMRNTLVRDRHYGTFTALGVLTGNLIHIGYCVVGIAVLVSRNPVLFQVLRFAGAIRFSLDRSPTFSPSVQSALLSRQPGFAADVANGSSKP